MDGGNMNVSMVEYDQLPVPELSEGLLGQIDANIKGTHWSVTHQCITMIRGICKTFPQHIPDIFAKYGMVLLELLNNGTTQNIKNIIKLLSEVFEQGENINIETLVSGFLPIIAKKAAGESGQIKDAFQMLMTIISSKCCYPRVI
jgi:hypothetical protein